MRSSRFCRRPPLWVVHALRLISLLLKRMKWRKNPLVLSSAPPCVRPTSAVRQFPCFHFYPPVRAPVRSPPPVSAPPPNPVHPPQPPALAPPRTLDPPLPVPSPDARPPGGLKPSPLPSSNRHRRPPIDTAVDHLPVIVLRAPSSDPSIDFVAAVVADDHAIPYRPLAMLAPPPRVDMLPHPPPSDPALVSSPASVAARLAR
jgi:hypothetical protein